jgi:hypothetical protein
VVAEAGGEALEDPRTPLGLCKEQRAAVRADDAAVETSDDLATTRGFEAELELFTLCHRRWSSFVGRRVCNYPHSRARPRRVDSTLVRDPDWSRLPRRPSASRRSVVGRALARIDRANRRVLADTGRDWKFVFGAKRLPGSIVYCRPQRRIASSMTEFSSPRTVCRLKASVARVGSSLRRVVCSSVIVSMTAPVTGST